MKRRELVRHLEQAGCRLVRHGGNHDVFQNPANGRKQPVPRHSEIDDQLVRHILKLLGLARPT
jgi:mRNA interferase HicA